MLDDIKKIYRAKYGSELEDDLEENVQKQYRAVVRTTCLFTKLESLAWYGAVVRSVSMRLLPPIFTESAVLSVCCRLLCHQPPREWSVDLNIPN